MNMQKDYPKFGGLISIVTVCYNSSKTIEDTLISVQAQDYKNLEHIVIDGASTDGTIEIIQRYKNIRHFISEPDSGIYDAMNKGLALAKGEIVGILNSDDIYYDNKVLSDVAEIFSDSEIEACYADLFYVDQIDTSKVVRYWKSTDFRDNLFKSGWMPAHPTFFVRRKAYEQFGNFDLNYKIAADFELLFRFIEKYKINTKYLPKVLVRMRTGGATNKSWLNIYKQNLEIIKTLKGYYKNFSVIQFLIFKISSRLFQFIRKSKR